jgi:2-methylisocitrate lyase-like PEP mutase family enzyme
MRRAHAYADAGADAVLVEAVRDLSLLKQLHAELPCPLVFNQIAGGERIDVQSCSVGLEINSKGLSRPE